MLRNREDCSIIENVFFKYAEPIFDMQLTDDPISLDKYPQIHEDRSMAKNSVRIEKAID